MYLLIKTTNETVAQKGSLFEAVRGHWKLNPDHASQCSHVIATIIGSKQVDGVYNIDKWYPSTLVDNKYVFSGDVDEQLEKQLVGKELNTELFAKGLKNPIIYVEEKELLRWQ